MMNKAMWIACSGFLMSAGAAPRSRSGHHLDVTPISPFAFRHTSHVSAKDTIPLQQGSIVPDVTVLRWYNRDSATKDTNLSTRRTKMTLVHVPGRVTLLAWVENPARCPTCDQMYGKLTALRAAYPEHQLQLIYVMPLTGVDAWLAPGAQYPKGKLSDIELDSIAAYVQRHHLDAPVAATGLDMVIPYKKDMLFDKPILVVIDPTGHFQGQVSGADDTALAAVRRIVDQVIFATQSTPLATPK